MIMFAGIGEFLMTPEFIQTLAMFVSAGAVYGAIKTDLKRGHERMNDLDKDIGVISNRFSDHIQDHARGTLK
jgi:hypothetical protein